MCIYVYYIIIQRQARVIHQKVKIFKRNIRQTPAGPLHLCGLEFFPFFTPAIPAAFPTLTCNNNNDKKKKRIKIKYCFRVLYIRVRTYCICTLHIPKARFYFVFFFR